ncbi:MAG: hypothetical protein WAK84_12315, partial [Candidatus Cybelea sp.]
LYALRTKAQDKIGEIVANECRMGLKCRAKVEIDTNMYEDGLASKPDAATSRELGWLWHF